MNEKRASLVGRSCVRIVRGGALLIGSRLELLETSNAELGGRLARLEGLLFALQYRVHELERGALPVQPPPSAVGGDKQRDKQKVQPPFQPPAAGV